MADAFTRTGSMRGRRLREFMCGPLPAAVWLIAAGAAGLLFAHRAQRFEYIGLARGLEYNVSAETTGSIAALAVDLCQDVEAGDALVKLDDALLRAGIETQRAAVRQLRAELDAARMNFDAASDKRHSDWEARLADFESREEKYRVDQLDLKVSLESDRVEEQRLGLDLDRYRKLLAAGVASRQEFDKINLRHEELGRRIAENSVLLAGIEKNLQDAHQRRVEFAGRMPAAQSEDAWIAPTREAIRRQELAIEELRIRRDALVLRAPIRGRVSRVLGRPGQAVTPGETIVVIGDRAVTQVVGYAAEADADVIHESMPALIARVGRPAAVAEARVIRVGAGVEPIPERLWRDSRRPEFGRAFILSASAPLDLLPNEKLSIRLAP